MESIKNIIQSPIWTKNKISNPHLILVGGLTNCKKYKNEIIFIIGNKNEEK